MFINILFMFIDILFWYILGMIIAYIFMGIWGLFYKNILPPEEFYIISWVAVACILLVISGILLIKLFKNMTITKWFNPVYTFEYLKEKYYASKK